MRILLLKLSDDHHRMTVERAAGPAESVELESRSYLLHDLAHYAVEAEARIVDGFYGLLASGVSLAKLNDRTSPIAGAGLMMAESLAAPLQSLFHGRLSRELYLEHGQSAYPELVDEGFVDGVLGRLRRLDGQYRATRYREAMELMWNSAVISMT
jgi:hypothetical protein